MAIPTRGTTMDNPDCAWVRGRLPIWRWPDKVADDPDDAEGDLPPSDRRSIERHLSACPACTAYRSGLTRALGALDAAASALPAATQTPSLWPALERRIAAHADSRAGSQPAPGGYTSAQREAACAGLDAERPLQSAWIHDSVGEVIDTLGGLVLSGAPGQRVRHRRAWHVAGAAGLAASILALLLVIPALWRGSSSSPVASQAGVIAVADQIGDPVPAEPEVASLPDSHPDDDDRNWDIPPGQLARADLPPPPVPASAPAEPTATAEVRAGATTRLGYDLEPGTPMPPDGRDAKPVY